MPFTTINSKSLFYTDTHPSSSSSDAPKSTTLFLHGLGSSSNFYEPIIPALKDVTRCIALDYPGSGLSELGKGELSLDSLARDVIELLKDLEVSEKVILVGHSMGGLLASHIACLHPSLIESLILLGPVSPSPSLGPIFGTRIQSIQSSGLEALASSIPSAATAQNASLLTKAFIRTLILSTSEKGYIELCKVIVGAERPAYEGIGMPVLMVVGEEDKTSPLESCEAILRAWGTEANGEEDGREDKRMVVLKGVGHWFCVEDPEAVGSAVKGFLESVG